MFSCSLSVPLSWLQRYAGLLRLFGGRHLQLNRVNIVGLRGVHRNDRKTAVRIARLNRLHRLGSRRAGTHRVGGECAHLQTGARVGRVRLLQLLFADLLPG